MREAVTMREPHSAHKLQVRFHSIENQMFLPWRGPFTLTRIMGMEMAPDHLYGEVRERCHKSSQHPIYSTLIGPV
jgi:hypothetical protein